MEEKGSDLLTVLEVCKILKVNDDTVRRLIKRPVNPLPAINIGSEQKPKYRVQRSKLETWKETLYT